MQKKEYTTIVYEYDIQEVSPADLELIEQAKAATQRSYSPYSKFSVGAALRLSNGLIIQGNNQENAAYPSGLCAERVAVFYANSMYPDLAVEALAVSVFTKGAFLETPAPPCGSCRQVLLETEIRFNKPIRIILVGNKKVQIIENVKSLLPINFDNEFLL